MENSQNMALRQEEDHKLESKEIIHENIEDVKKERKTTHENMEDERGI